MQEILGERRLTYDNFMVIGETEFELEAQKFLQDGYYASNVGDYHATGNGKHSPCQLYNIHCMQTHKTYYGM